VLFLFHSQLHTSIPDGSSSRHERLRGRATVSGLTWGDRQGSHAKGIIACDLFVTATVTFRLPCVFVVIHHGSRRLLHLSLT
jgi:hypothetical protein